MNPPLRINGFLSTQAIGRLREVFSAPLVDGRESGGAWGKKIKNNLQVSQEQTRSAAELLVRELFENDVVAKSCFPKSTVQPTFNVYRQGHYYGLHEDNPIQAGIRADLSYTLFMSDPQDYDGGELMLGIEEPRLSLKEAAGTLVVYETGIPHQVLPVRRGERRAIVGWIQSVVRSADVRRRLNNFYRALAELEPIVGVDHPAFAALNRIRIQIMRESSELWQLFHFGLPVEALRSNGRRRVVARLYAVTAIDRTW